MDERPVTPLAYLAEIIATSWRHGGEVAVAVSCVIVVGLTALWGSGHVFFLLLPAVGAVLLFEAGVAAWRLHRRQRFVLATRQSLIDLDASDRVDFERHLLARYRRRERRIENPIVADHAD